MKTARRFSRWLPPLALLMLAVGAPTHAELGPKRLPVLKQSGPARVIVKFRDSLGDARRTALAVRPAASAGRMSRQEVVQALQTRATQLGNRVGMALRPGRAIDDHAQVLMADGIDSAELVRRLASDPQVEKVVVDSRRYPLRVPNDSYYLAGPSVSGTSGGPVVGQWYLRAPQATTPVNGDESKVVSSINAEAAWDITIGHSSVIVADLDTGVRPEHPDLAGKIVAGYDMIGLNPTTGGGLTEANDGNLADPDPSDPGDWVTSADQATLGTDCAVEDSSWHGTQTAALIAAATNNAKGIAGAGWNIRVMPVRVLGKCGGYDSDIAAGIRWAVGLSVPGVPLNPTPAKVVNMSLGGSGYPAQSCTGTYYTDAISAAVAQGAVVVASAGNGMPFDANNPSAEGGHALNPPANCPGIVAVAGLRHVGTKVGFSDLGPDVTISAPAGNCVNVTAGSACLYPMMTLSNSGTTTPANSIYTDSFNSSIGTSFSAPLVSATAALMFTANHSLTPDQVIAALKASARPFPSSGAALDNGQTVVACTAPGATGQLQCYCTNDGKTCGAGMLDAFGAVSRVARLEAYVDASPASPAANQAVTLSAASTVLAPGHTVQSYAWSLVSDGGGIVPALSDTSSQQISITPTAAGTFTVRLTVTDSQGATSSYDQSVTVAGGSSGGGSGGTPSGSGGGGGGVASWTWLAGLGLATALLLPGAARRRRG